MWEREGWGGQVGLGKAHLLRLLLLLLLGLLVDVHATTRSELSLLLP